MHHAAKSISAVFAHKAIGVVLGGQKEKLHHPRIAGKRQHRKQGAAGGFLPRLVAIKAKNDLIAEAKQLLHMLGRASGAQGGHGIAYAVLRQRHHIHIAFGDQHKARLLDIGAAFKQAVNLAPFVKDGGFGRVQIFGFARARDAPAKGDDFAFEVADGEHDALAKAVVAPTILGGNDHARFF